MEEQLELTPKMAFYRDINNYVLINNDIYRREFANPALLNPTALTKTVFREKFGFSQEDYLSLPEFDGYTCEPDHFNYRQDINGKWNLYSQIKFEPKKGDWSYIEKLIKHLYGKNAVEEDQVEEFYDYHTVLLKHPKQMQQARILYSHQQGTSKSALAVLENGIFGTNYTKIRDSELTGDYNMIWIRSLIVHMDEPHFDQAKSTSRKIRDIITAPTMNLRKMKTDHIPVPFYGKLLFTTNDSDFMPIEGGDRRYWIREVPMFEKSDEEANFNEKMLAQIPAYLYFLLNERQMKYPEKADKTFWLPYEAISNSNAFKKMVKDTTPDFEVAGKEIIENWFIDHKKAKEVQFRLKDIKALIERELDIRSNIISNTEVVVFVRDKLGLAQPERTSRPKKDEYVITSEIDKIPGKWWRCYREDFDTDLSVFDDVKV